MRYTTQSAGVALCILGSTGFAESGVKATKKAVPVPRTITCAVVPKDMVNIQDATKAKLYADYKGNRYFFCCSGCPHTFKKNPAKFSKNAHIKIPALNKINAKKRS